MSQIYVLEQNQHVGFAIPFCVESLDLGTIVDIEYMEFMKAFDKVCLNTPKGHMNKYRQVTQVIGLFSNRLNHCICNVLSNGLVLTKQI